MRERENSTMKTKFTVTGTPPVPPKMTVECTGKETKKRARGRESGSKSPCTIFCTAIAGIEFLLEIVCHASRQRMVQDKRDTEVTKHLEFPLSGSRGENRTTVHHPLCSTKPLLASPSTTLPRQAVEEESEHCQKDSGEPQNLCLSAAC